MAFWRFGFAQSSIDSILANVQSQAASPSGPTPVHGRDEVEVVEGQTELRPPLLLNASSNDRQHSQNDSHLIMTLDQLLDEDDLLQECKSGHAKLVEFLGKPAVVRRMLQYIDNSAFSDDEKDDESLPAEQRDKIAKRRRKFPHVCAEIIMCNVHSIVQELLGNLSLYMIPLWDAVLSKDPLETLTNNALSNYWGKVNCHLLSEHTTEILACIGNQPDLIAGLVRHITAPAVSDFLFKIVQAEEMPSGQGIVDFLSQSGLIPKLIALLSPTFPPATHATVTEFIKAVITFCSTANANAGNAEFAPPGNNLQHQPQSKWAQAAREQQQAQEQARPYSPLWVSHALLRDLASRENIRTLLGFMLDRSSLSGPATSELKSREDDLDAPTPTAEKNQQEALLESLPSNALLLPVTLPQPNAPGAITAASTSSSIRRSLSIIIDLIRKNNSDFTEQQILYYLRKKEATGNSDMATGPSVVDLSHLLVLISERLGDLQNLLINPGSEYGPIETTLGRIQPLTIERFRVCELYAEILHCSNMAMLNRPRALALAYDAHGSLVGSFESLPYLEKALSTASGDEETAVDGAASDGSVNTSTYGGSVARSESSSHLDLANGIDEISFESDSVASPLVGGNSDKSPRAVEDLTKESPRGKANGVASKPEPLPGQQLKLAFLDHQVIRVLFDLFFDHPWHNFLHNVVYDLVQQLFNGRLDQPLNRRLCLDTLRDANLLQRILDTYAANQASMKSPHKRRLGLMGHLSLIAEEVVKLFMHHPDLAEEAAQSIPQPAWDNFVTGALKETREQDLQHLGGGISGPGNDTITSGNSALSDEDDELMATSTSKSWRTISGDEVNALAAKDAAAGDAHPSKVGADQHFAKFLARQQRTGNHPTSSKSSSSSEEDEDGLSWPRMQDSMFDPRDADVQLTIDSSDSDSDDDFGNFSTAPSNSSSHYANGSTTRAIQKTNLTSADFNSEFKSSFTFSPEPEGNPFESAEDDDLDDDNDFGAFASASPAVTASAGDFVANFDDSFGDFDKSEDADTETVDQSKETMRPDGLVAVQVGEEKEQTVIVPPDELAIATSPKLDSVNIV